MVVDPSRGKGSRQLPEGLAGTMLLGCTSAAEAACPPKKGLPEKAMIACAAVDPSGFCR